MIDHLTSFRAASKQHPLSFLYYSSATYSEFALHNLKWSAAACMCYAQVFSQKGFKTMTHPQPLLTCVGKVGAYKAPSSLQAWICKG